MIGVSPIPPRQLGARHPLCHNTYVTDPDGTALMLPSLKLTRSDGRPSSVLSPRSTVRR